MRWFGAVKSGSAFMAILETPDDALLHFVGNDKITWESPRLSSLSPVWLASHETLRYPRRVRYRWMPGAGHVEMAKAFREYAKANGLYKSLREKVDALPPAGKLVGAPVIWLQASPDRVPEKPEVHPRYTGFDSIPDTFDDCLQTLRSIRKLGIEKAFVILVMWEQYGVGVKEPDHWPPSERMGGLEAFKKIFSEAVARELPGFLLTFYNIYNDMYADAPSFDEKMIMKRPDGSLFPGGVWQGGRCYVTCSTKLKELSEAHFAEYAKHLRLEAMYYDNYVNVKECYDPEHPVTRSGDIQARIDFLDHTVAKGLAVGVEFVTDWIAAHVHYADGAMGVWQYEHASGRESCVPAPLWDLVYHDAMVNYWWHWNLYNFNPFYVLGKGYTWVEQCLQDVLCANPGT